MLAAVNLTKGANRGNYQHTVGQHAHDHQSQPTIRSSHTHLRERDLHTPQALQRDRIRHPRAMYNPNIGGGGVMGYQYTDMSGQRLFQNNGATAYYAGGEQ